MRPQALQKYLLTAADTLANPQTGDMNGDGRLNAADLSQLKHTIG